MTIEEAFTKALQQQQEGRLDEAEAGYRQLLTVDRNQTDVLYNLGLVLRQQGKLEEAVATYERALELKPRFLQAINNLGEALGSLGRLDEAEDVFRHALLLDPVSSDTWNNLGGVLKDLGRAEEAIECLERAVQFDPPDAGTGSNLVFTRHYSTTQDTATLLQAARGWNQQHAARLGTAAPSSHPNNPSGERRLRIGYVSPNFREHCQAFFTVPLLSHHDHAHFEIFLYSDTAKPDAMTARLRGYADHWRSTEKLDDAQLARLVEQDKIDILVDLTLHLAGHRLLTFAKKPAPVQVTWLGYPGTTGMDAINYRLTDPQLDPPGAGDGDYSEQSIRLPDSFWCYDPLCDEPAVNSLPAAKAGPITFGCLNNFCKTNDATLEMWAKVLHAVPDAKLLMLAPPGASRVRVKSRLQVASERVQFVAYQPRADYLKEYHRIDVCLDTYPYNGHTTSLDALWMGVPVISLSGPTVVSRAGLSLMKNIGLSEWVARDPAQFVQIATAWAQERDRLAALRSSLRDRIKNSPLMNADRFSRQVELVYRSTWRRWCARPPVSSP